MSKKYLKRFYKRFSKRGEYTQSSRFLKFQNFKTRFIKVKTTPPKMGGIKFKKSTVFKRNLKSTPLNLSKKHVRNLLKESLKYSLLFDNSKKFNQKYKQFKQFNSGKLSNKKIEQLIKTNSNLYIQNDKIEIVEKAKLGIFNKTFKNKTIDNFTDFLNKKEINTIKEKNKNNVRMFSKSRKLTGTMSTEMQNRFQIFLNIAEKAGGLVEFEEQYPGDFDRLCLWCGIDPTDLRKSLGIID